MQLYKRFVVFFSLRLLLPFGHYSFRVSCVRCPQRNQKRVESVLGDSDQLMLLTSCDGGLSAKITQWIHKIYSKKIPILSENTYWIRVFFLFLVSTAPQWLWKDSALCHIRGPSDCRLAQKVKCTRNLNINADVSLQLFVMLFQSYFKQLFYRIPVCFWGV